MIVKKYFMKSVNRITKDFKQRELLPLKLVFFVQATTIAVLYPYLTLHMRELGISVEEAAIMSAVIPVVGIFIPPLAGMVADKIGNFKLLLAFFSFIGGATALLLLLVPVGRITIKYPDKITSYFECGSFQNDGTGNFDRSFFQLGLSHDFPCDLVSGVNRTDSVDFEFKSRLEVCGYVCRSPDETYEGTNNDTILNGESYTIEIRTDSEVERKHYNLTKSDVLQERKEHLEHRIMANDDRFKQSIRRVAPMQYFLPASDLTRLSCRKSRESLTCAFGGMESEPVPFGDFTLKFHLKPEIGQNEFDVSFLKWISNEYLPVTCQDTDFKRNVTAIIHRRHSGKEVPETIPLSDCEPKCLLTSTRKNLCSNLQKEIHHDPQLTFWLYLVIRVFIGIIGSTSYAMYEVAVIAILREQKADYGLQRIYASIGGVISSPLSGMLIDYASQGKGYTDYSPAFYLYAALKTGTSILMLFIDLEFKKAATNVIKDAIAVLKNLEIIALLTACFVLGTAWGYIESFLFWFLEDLGGNTSLMGITIAVGGVAGIPLLILSGPIIDKIGHANVLFIGFIFYAIRLLGYSLIYNPYHCLYFEAMESITTSLAITAAITYAAKLSTTTTDGSVQGLIGGLYYGIGRGAGSLIGGYLMKAFGTRETYRIFAVFSIVTGFAYYLFYKFYLIKRRVEGNEICKKETKPKKSMNSDVTITTEKPKTEESASENNKAEKEAKVGNERKRGEEEEEERRKESHDNSGYVADVEGANAKNEEEAKKQTDTEEGSCGPTSFDRKFGVS